MHSMVSLFPPKEKNYISYYFIWCIYGRMDGLIKKCEKKFSRGCFFLQKKFHCLCLWNTQQKLSFENIFWGQFKGSILVFDFLWQMLKAPPLILGPTFSLYYNVIVGPKITISVWPSNIQDLQHWGRIISWSLRPIQVELIVQHVIQKLHLTGLKHHCLPFYLCLAFSNIF